MCIGDISHFRTPAQLASYAKPVPTGQTIRNTNQQFRAEQG
nr:IS110 family transposase [Corynebacterium mendelii]